MLESFLSNYLTPWAIDAVIDSVKTLPFLFLVFLFIELFEHYFAGKVRNFLKISKKQGPILGSIAASIPQCGFSVVASALYVEKYITRGTIIAVYLATSDEAIPVLLMYPKFLPYVLPLIVIKLLIAIPVGYLIDYFFKNNEPDCGEEKQTEDSHIEGCCRHDITVHKKYDFLIHPIKHTFGVFVFILLITLILNFLLEKFDITTLSVFKTHFAFLAPLVGAIVGLIPNCAISVGLVLMFVKKTITFGTMMSGLISGAGIGLLLLLKNNKNKKDTIFILFALVAIGYVSGLIIQCFE